MGLKNLFKKISLKVKIIIASIISILGAIFIFTGYKSILKKKGNIITESEKVLKENINNLKAEANSKQNNIKTLQEEEEQIKKNIEDLSSKHFIEDDDDISLEELDKFFKKRGL